MKREHLIKNGFRLSKFEHAVLREKIMQLFSKLPMNSAIKPLIEEFIPYGHRLTSKSKIEDNLNKKVEEDGIVSSTGKRKTTRAAVKMVPGTGLFYVNSVPLSEYFLSTSARIKTILPFEISGELGNFDVWATVSGGGSTGQSGAISLAVARAIVKFKGIEAKKIFESGI